MVDTRFHAFAGPAPLADLLAALDLTATLSDEAGPMIVGVEELATAAVGHIALAAHHSYDAALAMTGASAVIVSRAMAAAVPPTAVGIVADDPHIAFARLLEHLYPNDTRGTLLALLGPREAPYTESDVRLGPGVVLGPGVEIGRGTVIGPNTVIGAGVAIGRNCTIGSNCTLECAYVGNNVVLHSGARIGTEGFGWLEHGRGNRKIPQLGRVILQDRVEIGANSCVDRGALGDTVIGEGTKIDNLVQIGHNCRIGRNCLIAGMAGLAGSTILEDSVMVGAGAGTAGHLTIGMGSVLAGRSAVMNDLPPGSRVAGAPAQDGRAFMREVAMLRRMNKKG